jgi:hypothetical protein
LAVTSPTSGGHSVDIVRSRTKATELVGWFGFDDRDDDDVRDYLSVVMETKGNKKQKRIVEG